MSQYLLSPQAQNSLRQISEYTHANFGEQQRKHYLRGLRDRMLAIAENPTLGRRRDDIKSGYFSLPFEQHSIYYRTRDTHVEIIDVLHQSMEPELHL